jgi:transposase
VQGAVPQGHWETTTLFLAVRQAGLRAPMMTAGAMNGALFLASVKEFLCPTLAAGDLVIWDNLSVHQVAGVREAMEARGEMHQALPPDSPDLNPMEPVLAKLKAQMRAASERTVDALWKTLDHVLDDVPPAEGANILRGGRGCRTSKLKTL